MNIANKLTVARIILVPIFLIFLLTDFLQDRYLISCAIFLIASFTDHLDGRLARKYNMITDFGKFLDPLADKILVMSAFICFVQLNIISAIPVIIILSREFIVTSLRLVASSQGKVISANIFGKIKTFCQMISIAVILVIQHLYIIIGKSEFSLGLGKNDLTSIFDFTKDSLIWISVLFTIISGIIYVWDNRSLIVNND